MQEMIYMLDEIILVRMMITLDLKFEKAMHYHNEGYESNNDYGIPHQVTRAYLHVLKTSQLGPPSTQLNSPQPSALYQPSLPDIPEACHSEKGYGST